MDSAANNETGEKGAWGRAGATVPAFILLGLCDRVTHHTLRSDLTSLATVNV